MMINMRRLWQTDFSRIVLIAGFAMAAMPNPSVMAQCNGGGGGGAGPRGGGARGGGPMATTGGGAGAAFGGTAANGAAMQQMLAVAQRQAMLQQQMRLAALQQQQSQLSTQQRLVVQTSPSTVTASNDAPAIAGPNLYVESAQRRREAYLRQRRERNGRSDSSILAFNR